MPSQFTSLVDNVLSRDLEALERRKHHLEKKHEDKVKAALALVNGLLAPATQNFFTSMSQAHAFLKQCSMKKGDAPNIQTAPLSDYHEWALLQVEVQRLKLTRQKLLDRIRSEYALGRLKVA